MQPRRATLPEVRAVAQLWHDAWHETQAPYVPDDLIQRRHIGEFEQRVDVLLNSGEDTLRIAGPIGAPVGMCAIKQDELYQLFVAPLGRGTGIAAALLADGEQRLRDAGCKTAFLDCLVENEPAVKFYTRQGWRDTGVQIARLDTASGTFALPCLKFRKAMS